MPNKLVDLTGKRFGKLVVNGRSGKTCPVMWECSCDCGNTTIVKGGHLKDGTTVSCGCYREAHNKRARKHGHSLRASEGKTRTYITWEGMKQRCLNPNHTSYPRYGERGIKICEKWLEFDGFFEDMGERPEGKTLERRNNNGNYEPSNCYWATNAEQYANRKNTKVFEIDGITKTQSEWAKEYGMSVPALRARLNRGMNIKDALTTPLKYVGRPRRKPD